MLNLMKLPYETKTRCVEIALGTNKCMLSTISTTIEIGDVPIHVLHHNRLNRNNLHLNTQVRAALEVVARTMVPQEQTIVPLNAQPGEKTVLTVDFLTTLQQCVGNLWHLAKTQVVLHLWIGNLITLTTTSSASLPSNTVMGVSLNCLKQGTMRYKRRYV